MRTTILFALLGFSLLSGPVSGQDPQNARLGGQTDSAEKLLEKQSAEKPGIMGQSNSLVGRAMENASKSIQSNIPTASDVSSTTKSWWQSTKTWCSAKWQAAKNWWNGDK